MKQNELLRKWAASGSNAEELREIIKTLSESTKCLELSSPDINYFISVSHPVYENALVKATTSPIDGEPISIIPMSSFMASPETMIWGEETVKEAFQNKLFVSYFNGEKHQIAYTDENIPSSLTFLGISGDCCKNITWPWLSLVKQCTNEQAKVKLIVRESEDGVKKLLTLRSAQYMYIPQNELLEITEEVCPGGSLEFYNITNSVSEVMIRFESLAHTRLFNGKTMTFVPRIRFSTSDSGDASYKWKLNWSVTDGTKSFNVFLPVGSCEYSGRHKGKYSEKRRKEIISGIEQLFSKTTVLESQLEKLDKEIIYFPEVRDVVKNYIDDNKKFRQYFREELREQVLALACKEFCSPVTTAAEICLFLSGIPDRMENVTTEMLFTLRQNCGEFFYQPVRRTPCIKEE